jgi:hypothetical protein
VGLLERVRQGGAQAGPDHDADDRPEESEGSPPPSGSWPGSVGASSRRRGTARSHCCDQIRTTGGC